MDRSVYNHFLQCLFMSELPDFCHHCHPGKSLPIVLQPELDDSTYRTDISSTDLEILILANYASSSWRSCSTCSTRNCTVDCIFWTCTWPTICTAAIRYYCSLFFMEKCLLARPWSSIPHSPINLDFYARLSAGQY